MSQKECGIWALGSQNYLHNITQMLLDFFTVLTFALVIKTAGALPCKGVAPHCISSHCIQHLTLPFRKRPYKMGFIYECS